MGTLRTGTVIACTFAVSFFPAVSHAAAATGSAIPVETVVYEQGEKAQILAEGLSAYNHKDYTNATILLREAVAGGTGNPDVHFMLIMSEMFGEDYASVISDCDSFAAAYPDSPLISNVNYQKGKALHYKGDNDQAVLVLSDFCHENPQSPVYPSALYWIAECFYEDYNFQTAEGLFQRIIDVYPDDKKAVDAKYKIDAIAQREREQKLLDILKSNNEKFLEQKASYERQLKNYEGADVSTLKKELAEANARIRELEKLLADERTAVQTAKAEAASYKAEADAAKAVQLPPPVQESGTTAEVPASPVAAPASPAAVPASSARGITEQELLQLKLRASQLQRLLDEKSSASRVNKAE